MIWTPPDNLIVEERIAAKPRRPGLHLPPPILPAFFFPNCTCCGYAPITTCADCPTMPAQWTMTVAGITNGFCTNCGVWNGTFILTNHTITGRAGGACYSSSPAVIGAAPCLSAAANSPRWTMLVQGGPSAILMADGLGMGQWSCASFDCTGSNVFSKDAADTDCNNWPATITVDPV